jgi:predicted 3-demethylubiquinone-9 3-methyltransferase (glyoxalase superfamily)
MPIAASTCLWFNGRIEEAARFYVSLVPGSSLGAIERAPEGVEIPGPVGPGDALTIEFSLGGTPFQLLNGGPSFPQSEAASIVLTVDTQQEVDRLWEALASEGGEESQCGWCRDRYGVSWQIVPRRLIELSAGPHAAGVIRAMLGMKKLDIAALEAAARD